MESTTSPLKAAPAKLRMLPAGSSLHAEGLITGIF
jgi:hypothetical protein